MTEAPNPPSLPKNIAPHRSARSSGKDEAIDAGATVLLVMGLIIAVAFAILAVILFIRLFPK
jgi:hypothetical protein